MFGDAAAIGGSPCAFGLLDGEFLAKTSKVDLGDLLKAVWLARQVGRSSSSTKLRQGATLRPQRPANFFRWGPKHP